MFSYTCVCVKSDGEDQIYFKYSCFSIVLLTEALGIYIYIHTHIFFFFLLTTVCSSSNPLLICLKMHLNVKHSWNDWCPVEWIVDIASKGHQLSLFLHKCKQPWQQGQALLCLGFFIFGGVCFVFSFYWVGMFLFCCFYFSFGFCYLWDSWGLGFCLFVCFFLGSLVLIWEDIWNASKHFVFH